MKPRTNGPQRGPLNTIPNPRRPKPTPKSKEDLHLERATADRRVFERTTLRERLIAAGIITPQPPYRKRW